MALKKEDGVSLETDLTIRMPRTAASVFRNVLALMAFGLAVCLASMFAPTPVVGLALVSFGGSIVGLAALLGLISLLKAQKLARQIKSFAQFIEKDGAPTFLASAEGTILAQNPAAFAQFSKGDATTVAKTLATELSNPSGILFRMQSRAASNGSAIEDLSTRNHQLRLSAHQAEPVGFIWRMELLQTHKTEKDANDYDGLPMLMVGRAGTILFMNEAAREFIGDRAKSLDQLFADVPVEPGAVMTLNTAEGGKPALVVEVEAAAGRRALYLLPPPEETGQVKSWQVFQDLPVPMIKVDPYGTVQSYNRLASGLIGVALEEGEQLSNLMEGLGRSIQDWLSDTLGGRLGQKSEFLRLTRSDKEVFVQVTLNRVSEEGKPALIAVLNDATELKTLEAQFVQSQKMQAIGQLAGGVAHDFNNLLTAISGHCDLLLLRHDQGDPDYSDLVQINQNANRAAALVGQLLAFSRKQTLRPETLDMRDTLADLTHLLNRLVGEKVTLTLSHDPVLEPIRADKRQLEQVLMNLVVNARDALPAGGEIRILTEAIQLKEPLSRDQVTVPAGDYVKVQVADDGVGIASDKLQKVFEPFFTTKRTGEGTGLGLSTAYGIVKQSGGYIFVDSVEGQGTCFSLFFPTLVSQVATIVTKPILPKLAQAKHGEGVILLVEDEAPVRAFASRALRMRGYTVLEADSAETALETLEDKSLNIDVFVTDVVMPGMDGPSWVRQALQQRPDVRVVFVSGYAEESFEEEQTKIPNSVFLPKPFSLNDLTETVHNQLH